jgi:hypothetical protein
VEKHRAFWIDIQEYIEQGREFEEDQDEAIIRIPIDNKLTVRAVDQFRRMSLDRIERLRNPRRLITSERDGYLACSTDADPNQIEHHFSARKPTAAPNSNPIQLASALTGQ